MADSAAVAILVDASLGLASQWHQVLTTYVSAFLLRLVNGRSTSSFYIGFVSYSTADTRPTPILSKRYFSNPHMITKDLKNEFEKLGVGRCTGGSTSMAVLEGYAATLEMFDLFTASQFNSLEHVFSTPTTEPATNASYHIIHFAHAGIDQSIRPIWNQNSELDDLSWQTLPEAIRKRNIHLSMVLLRPDNQLTEIFKQTSTDTSQLWFTPLPGHAIHISGFPTVDNAGKRPTEATADRPEDSKRARVSSTPKLANSPASAPVASASTPSNEPTPQTQAAEADKIPTNVPVEQMKLKVRQLEQELEAKYHEIRLARAAGKTEGTEEAMKALQVKRATYEKFKQFVERLSGMQAKTVAPTPTPSAVTQPSPSNNPPQTQTQTQQSVALAQKIQNRFSQPLEVQPPPLQPSAMPPNIPPVPPAYAAPMQKLMEANKARPPPPPSVSTPQAAPKPESQTWSGTFTWAGFDPASQMKKEISAQVLATCTPGGNMRPDTWPTNLTLAPSREASMSPNDMRAWIVRNKAAICSIGSHPSAVDARGNEVNLKSLHTLLTEKKVYALAPWEFPAGGQKKPRLLIFPMMNQGNQQLFAAVFPETGVPDLPKTVSQAPQPQSVVMPQNTIPNQALINQALANPAIANALANRATAAFLQSSPPGLQRFPPNLANLTQEQKQEIAALMIRQRQQQAMAAAAGGSMGPFSGGVPNPMAMNPGVMNVAMGGPNPMGTMHNMNMDPFGQRPDSGMGNMGNLGNMGGMG